jgi:YidC/Oxa1 family membrane protein insertase
MQQRIFLYLAPGSLLVSGTLFPIGVLTYWLTTNLWSMGQQFFVLRTMPAPGTDAAKHKEERDRQKGKLPDTPAPAPVRYQQVRRDPAAPGADGAGGGDGAAAADGANVPSAGGGGAAKPRPVNRPPGQRPHNQRRGKKRKGGRR